MAAGAMSERARWLAQALSRAPNPLRRRVDRRVALLMVAVLALAVLALPVAAVVGYGTHHRLLAQVAEQASTRNHVAAELVDPPRMAAVSTADPHAHHVQFQGTIRWVDPLGREHTARTGVSDGSVPGDTVRVWVDQANRLVPPPLSPQQALASAISTGFLLALGAALACSGALVALRAGADAHAQRCWAREWEVVSPRWTRRGPADKG